MRAALIWADELNQLFWHLIGPVADVAEALPLPENDNRRRYIRVRDDIHVRGILRPNRPAAVAVDFPVDLPRPHEEGPEPEGEVDLLGLHEGREGGLLRLQTKRVRFSPEVELQLAAEA